MIPGRRREVPKHQPQLRGDPRPAELWRKGRRRLPGKGQSRPFAPACGAPRSLPSPQSVWPGLTWGVWQFPPRLAELPRARLSLTETPGPGVSTKVRAPGPWLRPRPRPGGEGWMLAVAWNVPRCHVIKWLNRSISLPATDPRPSLEKTEAAAEAEGARPGGP